jgi:hypothetical protein
LLSKLKKLLNTLESAIFSIAELIELMPFIISEKPVIISPVPILLLFLERIIKNTPINPAKVHRAEGVKMFNIKLSADKPDSDIIHAVTLVPILAPIIIGIELKKLKSSASHSPIKLTVTAEEL